MLVSLRRFHRNWILLRIFSLRMIAAVPVSKISTVDSRTLPSYISYNLIMWPRKMPNRSPTAGWKHFSWNSYHKTFHEISMSPRWTAFHTFTHSFLTLVCHKCILTYIASQKLDLYLIQDVQALRFHSRQKFTRQMMILLRPAFSEDPLYYSWFSLDILHDVMLTHAHIS